MRIQKGDTVFGAEGRPGIVQGRDVATGLLETERQGPTYERTRRIGYVNGLRPGEREVFNTVVEKLRSEPEAEKRLQTLGEIIQDLSKDPHNIQLVRYLEAEKAHLMYSEGISPRVYTIDESKI